MPTKRRKPKHKVLPCPCCGSSRIKVGTESALSDSVYCHDCGLRVIVTLDWLQAQVETLATLDEERQREACQIEAVKRWNVRNGEERRLAGSLRDTASMICDCVNDIRWGIGNSTKEGDLAVGAAADRLDAYATTLRIVAGKD